MSQKITVEFLVPDGTDHYTLTKALRTLLGQNPNIEAIRCSSEDLPDLLKFHYLAETWIENTSLMSCLVDVYEDDAYKAILKMGPVVKTYILEGGWALGDPRWAVVLSQLDQENR